MPSCQWTLKDSSPPDLKKLPEDFFATHEEYEGGGIRKARKGDGEALAPRLREVDKIEISAVSNEKHSKLLEDAIEANAYTYAIMFKDRPVALLGLTPYNINTSMIWMVGSEEIVPIQIPFLRNSLKWVKAFHELYPVLFNFVSVQNELHIKWLKWLGFTFGKTYPEFGLNKQPFIEFYKIKEDFVCVQ